MFRKIQILWLYFKVMRHIKQDKRDEVVFGMGKFRLMLRFNIYHQWQLFLKENIDNTTDSHTDGVFTDTNHIWQVVFKPHF